MTTAPNVSPVTEEARAELVKRLRERILWVSEGVIDGALVEGLTPPTHESDGAAALLNTPAHPAARYREDRDPDAF